MGFSLTCGRIGLACTAGLLSVAVGAYQQGDMVVRFGASALATTNDSSSIRANGVSTPGAAVKVNSNTQPELGLMYMFRDGFAAEVKVSTPFQNRLSTKGYKLGAIFNPTIGSVSIWSPEANLQWYPMDCKSVFQPYVGVGMHYTLFSNEKAYGSWITASGSNTNVDLSNKFGWNAQLGIDVGLNDRWFLNAAARYVDMRTHMRVSEQNGTVYTSHLHINPMVYTLGVAYKF